MSHPARYWDLIILILLMDRVDTSMGGDQLFNSTIRNLHFHKLEEFLKISEYELTVIQRDCYNPGLLLVADPQAIWNINLTSETAILLYGTTATSEVSVDGAGPAMRFSRIMDLIQFELETVFVIESYCIRRLDRLSQTVSTMTGDCKVPGTTTGNLSIARYTNIVSAVIMNSIRIGLAEGGGSDRVLLLDLDLEQVWQLAHLDKINTLFVDKLYTKLYIFSEGNLKTIDFPIPFLSFLGTTGGNSTADGNLTSASFNKISDGFFYDDVILSVDEFDSVIRVVDTKSKTVTSICHIKESSIEPSTPVYSSNISTCMLQQVFSAAIIPELGVILLGGYKHLIKLDISIDYTGCQTHSHCLPYCKAGKTFQCRTGVDYICDPFLKHCSIRCGTGGVHCPPQQRCTQVDSGLSICRRSCRHYTDCLFTQKCFAGYCVKQPPAIPSTAPPKICLGIHTCIHTPTLDLLSYEKAKESCKSVNSSIISLSGITEDEYVLGWTSALLSTLSTISKVWIDFELKPIQEKPESSIFEEVFKLRTWFPAGPLFYNLFNSTWGVSTNHSLATALCIQRTEAIVTGNQECEQRTSLRNCLAGNSSMECLAEVADCCQLTPLLDHDIVLTDLEEFARLNFGKKLEFDCLSNQRGIKGSVEAVCLYGEWLISECIPEDTSSADCSLPGDLPPLYRLIAGSNTTSRFMVGDILLLGCDGYFTSTASPMPLNVLTCMGGTWSPPTEYLQKDQCLDKVARHPQFNWRYNPSNGLCYSLIEANISFYISHDICVRTSSKLVEVDSSTTNNFLKDLYSNKAFWVSGQYNPGQAAFLHSNGRRLDYTNFPVDQKFLHSHCIQIGGKDDWLVQNCSSSSDGAVCQTSALEIKGACNMSLVESWSSWSTWTQCTTGYTRYRTRQCLTGTSWCSACDGESVQKEKCCQRPVSKQFAHLYHLKEHTVGSQMYYECPHGYVNRNGGGTNITIQCLADGTWNDSPPTCVAVPCTLRTLSAPPDSNSYILSYTSVKDYYFGSYVYRVCNQSGFVFTNSSVSRTKIMCQSGGWWVGDSTQTCEERNCGRVPDIENAIWNRTVYLSTIKEERREKDLVYYLDQIIFNCLPDYHYRQSDEFTLTCQSDGTLDLLQPRCVEKLCERMTADLPKYAHITSELPVKFGESTNLTCDESYVLDKETREETQLVTCVEINRWQLAEYRPCVLILCNLPPKAVNIKSHSEVENRKVGEKIVYLCADGMIDYRNRRAVVEIECLPDLTWSASPAYCSEIFCEEPGELEHADRIISGFRVKDTVTYTCWPGYILAGKKESVRSYRLTCQENALWDGNTVSCINDVPYHSLTLESVSNKAITISLIQRRDYDGVNVEYHIIASGKKVRRWYSINETVYKQLNRSVSGIVFVTIDLYSGFHYNITVESKVRNEEMRRRQLQNYSIYIQSREPKVFAGLSMEHSAPILRADMSTLVSLPFETSHSGVRAFTIIVCDMITYLPKEYYDGKLVGNISNYAMVTAAEENRPIWGCYQTMAPCPVDDYSNCKDVTGLENGYIRYYEIQRLRYRVGAEKCDNPSARSTYCNGPLKSMSTFCVKLRTYGDDDYFDSPCSQPVTTSSEFTLRLLSTFIIPVTIVVLMVVCGETCRLRYNAFADSDLSIADMFMEVPYQQRFDALPLTASTQDVGERRKMCGSFTLELYYDDIAKDEDECVLASYQIKENTSNNSDYLEKRLTMAEGSTVKKNIEISLRQLTA